MPKFSITKKSTPPKTYRVEAVRGSYDLRDEKITEHFEGSIDIEDKPWNVGLIYGASGTGKSSIARELFGDCLFTPSYSAAAVIDDMPKDASMKDICKMFMSVGFASVPSWLKPYEVLSNGEKMRVDLANAILQDQEIIAFDEYTSVINREVAQVGSHALQKAVRKMNKKFIAVTCHYDVLDWLEPDWVFNTNEMKFDFMKGADAQKDGHLNSNLEKQTKAAGNDIVVITI